MKLSPYFDDLFSAYAFEIEDLTYDSGGANVLKARLKDKRQQFDDLMQMSDSYPVMVVPAFHGGFKFASNEVLDDLVSKAPGEFPDWATLAATLEMTPWAEALAERALQCQGGEQLMLIAAALEYILARPGAAEAVGHDDALEEPDDADDGEDLREAGEDWLGDQGFDRRE